MTDMLATFFVNPLMFSRQVGLLMLLPLCLAISIVYKTVKVEELHQIPAAVATSWVTILLGMGAVSLGIFILYHLAA